MTSFSSIPILIPDAPGVSRVETQAYRFPPARPCAPSAEQCADGDLRRIVTDALANLSDLFALAGSPEHLRRVLELAQRSHAELVAERTEVNRLARLHADLSRQLAEVLALHRALIAENGELRRRLEPDLAAQTLRFGAMANDDTHVVDVPLPVSRGVQ